MTSAYPALVCPRLVQSWQCTQVWRGQGHVAVGIKCWGRDEMLTAGPTVEWVEMDKKNNYEEMKHIFHKWETDQLIMFPICQMAAARRSFFWHVLPNPPGLSWFSLQWFLSVIIVILNLSMCYSLVHLFITNLVKLLWLQESSSISIWNCLFDYFSCEVTYPLPRHFSRWFFVFPGWDMLVPGWCACGTSSCHRSWWLRPFPVPPDSSQGFWGSQALGRHDDKTKNNQNQPGPKNKKKNKKKYLEKRKQYSKKNNTGSQNLTRPKDHEWNTSLNFILFSY